MIFHSVTAKDLDDSDLEAYDFLCDGGVVSGVGVL